MKYLYDPKDEKKMTMMPQIGVKQYVFDSPNLHNASWDSLLTREGRLFFSLCSELTTSEYAKLMEYDYENNDVIEHLYSKDIILPRYRNIRDSKFHTSICEKNDGTLIMATHTTDKSPCHPAWLPEAYYNNVYEGYPGGSLIEYNPDNHEVSNLGIPAIRESIYGGKYDPINDAYYMLGFMKGHLYRYGFKTKEVEDYGQVSEKATYRLVTGSDGNIYFSTRSGFLQRINTRKNIVENLNIELPNSSDSKHLARSYMCSAVNGPDARLYIALQFHDELLAYDSKNNTIENLGRFMLEEEFMQDGSNNAYIGAMDFDNDGVLWYLICCLRHNRKEDYKPSCVLMRWDILNNKKPERIGLAGTTERAITTSVGLYIDKNRDLMYMISTNHGDDGIDITAVDLKEFNKHLYEVGPLAKDKYIYPDNGLYNKHNDNLMSTWNVIDNNSAIAKFNKIIPVKIWQKYYNSTILDIEVDSDILKVYLDKGILLLIDEKGEIIAEETYDELPRHEENKRQLDNLPYIPGRQYLAQLDKSIEISKDERLSSTKDGYLFLEKSDGKIYGLGMPGFSGPVHDMVCKDGIVYGIAGDKEDLGMIFSYDNDNGLRLKGRLSTDGYEYGIASSCELFKLAIYHNNLVIVAKDRLTCLYICQI